MKLFFPLVGLVFFIAGCTDYADRLRRQSGTWWLERSRSELYLDGSLVLSQDSSDLGWLHFREADSLTFTPFDSSGRSALRWRYLEEEDAIVIEDSTFRYDFVAGVETRETLVFRIVENNNPTIWRADERFRRKNPFTGEEGEAQLIVQWQLRRERE